MVFNYDCVYEYLYMNLCIWVSIHEFVYMSTEPWEHRVRVLCPLELKLQVFENYSTWLQGTELGYPERAVQTRNRLATFPTSVIATTHYHVNRHIDWGQEEWLLYSATAKDKSHFYLVFLFNTALFVSICNAWLATVMQFQLLHQIHALITG